ncbi:MAG TPA: PrsW family glutamic-type intramembrane protease [Steroidobacteraceae bacterium]|nr:PrsW family glutamic-type intramembrane protease [Steroidobacteraceae bacterium]
MSADVLVRAPLVLLPVLLFLAGLVQLDGYRLVRMRMMLALMATGAIAAALSYLLNNLAFAQFHGSFVTYSRYVSPWIEESLKAALLVFLIRTRRVGLPVDAGIAGFAIGTGFAVIENLYYLAARPHTVLAVQVIRGFGTAIMHGGTAAILAMISNTLYERRPGGGLQLLLPGLCAAVALHTGYNYLLARPALATLATLLVLPFVIYLVFDHSERVLRDWIEADLESDVKRLGAISTGTFLDSPSGRYLRALRERFEGEQLADMLCYLRVHGELAVRAKGLLLLRETGMPEPPLDAETRGRLAELAQLERAIGNTGMLALRPLLMSTGKEIWQLTLLRQ